MKKITLAGLKYDENLGDEIIFDNVEYMLKNMIDCEINEVDLLMRIDKKVLYKPEKICKIGVIERLSFKLSRGPKRRIKEWNMQMGKTFREYLSKSLSESDLILFAGGGLIKYKKQELYFPISEIIRYAQIHEIPVVFSGVGVEGYDSSDYFCQYLKRYLNSPVVKMISTRDDLITLRDQYIYTDKKMFECADSAVMSRGTYKIIRNSESETIGLGIARGNIFNDYGINMSEQEIFDLWVDIVNRLNESDLKWKIFTNGYEGDYTFAKKVADIFGANVIHPKHGKELVAAIASYKGIIATRLHSCIVAYSLDIPAIGLVWNNKMNLFGEKINRRENFIDPKNFNDDFIINALKHAMKIGYDSKEKYIHTAYDSVKTAVEFAKG